VKDLLHLGETRLNLLRTFNAREGIDSSWDVLPKKLFQPKVGGASDGVAITREEFESAKTSYYQLAGWDPDTGIPTRAKLEELELGWAADMLG
jgi:aldehyde:ferredoxin oxidoreductase